MINRKKITALAVSAMLAVSIGVTGCSVDAKEAVITSGKDSISYDMVNFAMRYTQMSYESSGYSATQTVADGKTMWNQEVEKNKTYEEQVKKSVIDSLKEMYVLDSHKKEYKVSLTKDEEKTIQKTAKEFMKANDKAALEEIGATQKIAEEFLRLNTVKQKMQDAIKESANTKVSDKEAAQKKIMYAEFSFTKKDKDDKEKTMSKKEKKQLKKEAEKILKESKNGGDFETLVNDGGYTISSQTFDSETTTPDKKVIKAAMKLKKTGDFTDLITGSGAYFIARLDSELDREATDEKKETLAQEKKTKKYEKTLKKWKKEADFKVNKSAVNKISFATAVVQKGVSNAEGGSDTSAAGATTENSIPYEGPAEDTTDNTGTADNTGAAEGEGAAEGTGTPETPEASGENGTSE